MKRDLMKRLEKLEAKAPKPDAVNAGTPILTRESLPWVLRILAEAGPPPGPPDPLDPTMPAAGASDDELAAWFFGEVADEA